MLFKRRTPLTIGEHVRGYIWPRRSWLRSTLYMKRRMLRLRAQPHQLALGGAFGVFAAITPLFGVQMLLAAILALIFRASVLAALLGTFFGNPVTWPFIWAATYASGCYMLGMAADAEIAQLGARVGVLWQAVLVQSPGVIDAASGMIWPVLAPMLAGSVPVGIVLALIFYYIIKRSAAAFQFRRRVPVVA